ncbi:MAG: alpha/beta hydrolase [Patescibacteria group bacterium]
MFTLRTYALPDGVPITYGDASGPSTKAPVLILLPGQKRIASGKLGRDFIPEQVQFLTERFRVISWNYRLNNFVGEGTNISRMAKDLVAFLESENLRDVCLYAYSYGGMVAVRTATLVPERLHCMVFLNTFPTLSYEWFGFNRLSLRFLIHLLVIPSASSSHIRESMYPSFRQRPQGYRSWIGVCGNWIMNRNIGGFWHKLWSPRIWSGMQDDITPLLPGITTPSLILGGMADAACLIESAQVLARELPNNELVILENAGHYTVRIWPEAFNLPIRDYLIRQYSFAADALPLVHTEPPQRLRTPRILRTLVVQYWQWIRSRFV